MAALELFWTKTLLLLPNFVKIRKYVVICTISQISCLLERPPISWIKNSIKPNRVQHILRHIYYATMQKLCKSEALSGPKNPYKSHKDSP